MLMTPAELKSSPHVDGEDVRQARAALGLSASEAADIVGLNDGAAWRKWERNGVTGTGAVLVKALMESAAVRRYFRVVGTLHTRERAKE